MARTGESTDAVAGEGRSLPACGDDETVSGAGDRATGTNRAEVGDRGVNLDTAERADLMVGQFGARTETNVFQNPSGVRFRQFG